MTPTTVFVYGSLKRGREFHDEYCPGARDIRIAAVTGRLYRLADRYPLVRVPESHIVQVGTFDRERDVSREIGREPSSRAEPAEAPATSDSDPRGWRRVPGEVFTFDDGASRLRDLDHLEGFEEGAPRIYRRVLLRLTDPPGLLAWAYVAWVDPDPAVREGCLAIDRW